MWIWATVTDWATDLDEWATDLDVIVSDHCYTLDGLTQLKISTGALIS